MKNINELIDTNLNIEINNLSDNSKQIDYFLQLKE